MKYHTTIINTFEEHIESKEHKDQAAYVAVFACKENAADAAIGWWKEPKIRKRTVTVDGIKVSLFFVVQDQS